MASLMAMNMKRKEHAEVDSHGFSIFLDPKRLKLQDCELPDIMEEEKLSVGAPIDANMPTMALSCLLPIQGQEVVHQTLNTEYGMASSEPQQFSTDQVTTTAPMDVEVQLRQPQPQAPPCQQAAFWSGFF